MKPTKFIRTQLMKLYGHCELPSGAKQSMPVNQRLLRHSVPRNDTLFNALLLALLVGLLCAALFAGYLASQAKEDKADVALQAAIKTETVDGDLRGAIEQYKKIAALPGAGRATVATALLRMGQCHEKLGAADSQEAR